MKVSVGVSNRHIHLTESDFKKLFGGDAVLEKKYDLHQKGEFASTLSVTIEGPKGKIENVRVIGSLRNYTQVEISKTDSYLLGLNPPIRKSGNLENSESCFVMGPYGSFELINGVILAERHIHITKEQLNYYGLDENKTVNVIVSGEKATMLSNVHLKVSDNAYFELHLDTDDANACNLKNGDIVDIL